MPLDIPLAEGNTSPKAPKKADPTVLVVRDGVIKEIPATAPISRLGDKAPQISGPLEQAKQQGMASSVRPSNPKGPGYGQPPAGAENGMAGNAKPSLKETGPSKSSGDVSDFVRGGTSVLNGASPAPTPPKITQPELKPGQRNSSDLGGTKAGVLPTKQTGPPKSSGANSDFVRGGSQGSSIGNVGTVKPPKLADPKDPGPKEPGPGGDITSTDTSATPGMLNIVHDGQKGSKAGGKSDSGGKTVAPVGGSAGLSDLEKVRKFTYQIERTEGKLGRLADQETELRQKMAVSNDGEEKRQLAAKLVSVHKAQKAAGDRLDRKEYRLDNVKNRMASAGTTDQLDQGVRAVAVAGNGNRNNNGNGNGNGNGGGGGGGNGNGAGNNNALPGGGGGNNGNGGNGNGGNNGNRNNGNGNNNGGGSAITGVGGPDSGRPQAGTVNPDRNNNGGGGNGGNNGNGAGNNNSALPGGGGNGNGNGNGGNGGGGGNNGNGGGNRNNGGGGGGNRNANAVNSGGGTALAGIGGPDSGRPQIGAVDPGNNGGGGKKDNDSPKVMGGQVGGGGGGGNDSLPNNPPKLVSLGGGGGGGGGGKFGKNR